MSAGMIWDDAVDKKVKSSDDKDLGKIQKVTKEYIQVNEGLVSKKSYFIPKYYVQGYDGNYLWVSLTKEEIKSRYERDNPPSDAELRTQEDLEQKKKATIESPQQQLLHGVPFVATESGVTIRNEATGEESKIEWAEVIHKH